MTTIEVWFEPGERVFLVHEGIPQRGIVRNVFVNLSSPNERLDVKVHVELDSGYGLTLRQDLLYPDLKTLIEKLRLKSLALEARGFAHE